MWLRTNFLYMSLLSSNYGICSCMFHREAIGTAILEVYYSPQKVTVSVPPSQLRRRPAALSTFKELAQV